MAEITSERQKRKEEGKRKKRQRIEEAGGVRPRTEEKPKKPKSSPEKPAKQNNDADTEGMIISTPRGEDYRPSFKNYDNNKDSRYSGGGGKSNSYSKHRFGRVMESVPCRNKPRYSTLSIALPGSVLSNCQTRELRTLLVGQIARAATIYHVDEIIVFDDKLGKDNSKYDNNNRNGGSWRDFKRRGKQDQDRDTEKQEEKTPDTENDKGKEQEETRERRPRSNNQEYMARLLQYCECPQYLRRNFFPMHPDLQFAGLLAPIDAPHHVREGDRSKYREGIVMKKYSPSGNSFVNCGIRNRPVEIDRKLTPGIRCTVQLDPAAYGKAAQIKGTVVSPSAPREDDGTYWGYITRIADSINDVFENCPFSEAGYDLKMGTSERGSKSVEDKSFGLPKFRHSLLVFGGVAGIEECVDADESIKIPGASSSKLFDLWLNTCPFQGSRTIRTEEAVMISLAKINPFRIKASSDKPVEEKPVEDEEFSDESPSDESSDEDESEESSEEDDDDDDGK
jgi:predicted SPOUT superfamily RNA methylase MTH1